MVMVLVAALVVWFMLPPITPPQRGDHPGPGGQAPVEGSTDGEHPHFGDAHSRAEADAEAVELEKSYVAEAAAEFQATPPGETDRA